ncbi:Bile acid-coenzyme A ligase [Paraconexibacter sp. AEG42_29]|uniref:Bile acid-coenzyme A ligase n=1 Tax=Paraconexibacter sp. AEG42_29 TaxID=2997339 RepID=A0AAU7ARP6_9ACTN
MSATELTRHARERPGHPAFVVAGGDGGTRTYAELEDRSSRLASVLLGAGLQPDDVVAVVMDNRVEFAEAMWAPLRSGLRVAALNTHLHPAELQALLRAAAPRAIITDRPPTGAEHPSCPPHAGRMDVRPSRPLLRISVGSQLESLLAAAARLDPAHERAGARIAYSSGTTGLPKAIAEPLPDRAGDGDALPPPRLAPLMELLGIGADSVVLSPGPCYHSAPFGFTSTTQRLGGTAVTSADRFDPQACLDAVREHGVTHLHLVPTMLVRLLRLPQDARAAFAAASPLQAVVLGGGACAPQVKADALEWLGPIVHEYYGASEGYGQTYASPLDAVAHPGTIGRPVSGTIAVTDPADGSDAPVGVTGRITFGRGGFGDLGHLDEDGFLYLDGRESQVVISGGVNVHPQEVEDRLLAHAAVLDAAVFGVPDDEYGERLVALVHLVADTDAHDLPAELAAHCREQLAGFKCPRTILLTDSIPRSAAGKLRVSDARIHYQEVLACHR